MAIKIYVDKTGKIIGKFSPKEWANWVNSFIEEKAFLLVREKVNIKEESLWLAKEIEKIKNKEVIKIIALDNEKIVGVCDVHKALPLEAHGHNVSFGLAVIKKYRRQGIGEILLKKGIEIAKKEFKAKNIWIEVIEGNKPAINLYQKLGFKIACKLKNYVNHFGNYKDRIIMKLEK